MVLCLLSKDYFALNLNFEMAFNRARENSGETIISCFFLCPCGILFIKSLSINFKFKLFPVERKRLLNCTFSLWLWIIWVPCNIFVCLSGPYTFKILMPDYLHTYLRILIKIQFCKSFQDGQIWGHSPCKQKEMVKGLAMTAPYLWTC